eukprot:806332-Prorocentrum_minimum.AAC.3
MYTNSAANCTCVGRKHSRERWSVKSPSLWARGSRVWRETRRFESTVFEVVPAGPYGPKEGTSIPRTFAVPNKLGRVFVYVGLREIAVNSFCCLSCLAMQSANCKGKTEVSGETVSRGFRVQA